MKAKEYIKKYGLDAQATYFPREAILTDFEKDFSDLLMVGKARENIKGYENAIRAMHMKKESIVERTHFTLHDSINKTWNAFYASLVAPMREELFPEEMKKRREEKKQREEFRNWEYGSFGGGDTMHDFFRRAYENLFQRVFADTISKYFSILGLTISATVEDVKASYRKLVFEYHPDKGGDRRDFEKVTDAKEKCLKYLGTE